MANTCAPIMESLKFTDMIMNLVTSDLTEDVATRRSRDDEGASIAWIIGHLCHYRYEIAKLLGGKPRARLPKPSVTPGQRTDPTIPTSQS